MGGIAMTDQWTLNRRNFEGVWEGKSLWFGRDSSGALDLRTPMRVIDPTTYAIGFSDADTGVWDGSGLFFAPGGHARYAINRASYNSGGGCWQFPGAGGQSSLGLDARAGRFGHEINLFRGRSRSMLVLMWTLSGKCWSLNQVGAVAFRCRQAAEPDPERPTCGTLEALLEPLRGWSGVQQTLTPTPGVEGRCSDPVPATFLPEEFLRHHCSSVMADGLVFSVPEQLPSGGFRLEVGGLLAPDLFQQISIVFGADGALTGWERRRFQPDQA